jgi:hypothetical protein
MRVKITVRTLADAVGDVDVERKGFLTCIHVAIILWVKQRQRNMTGPSAG